MIGSLRGVLADRSGTGEVLIEVGGVGYRVTVTPTTVVELGEPGAEVFVHVHHHLREDAQTLYGFLTRDERDGFEALLGAHGVGPALALAILSVHGPDALALVIAEDDVDALCLVPGVGKKTAARLLIELKSRLRVPVLEASTGPARSGTAGSGRLSARSDVRDALANLGYGPDEVAAVVRDLPDDEDVSVLLKQALQRLAVS
ncbi:MAG TPA: Holliday junction branch migration protein RuvA [Acidimicrobiales bacterium]